MDNKGYVMSGISFLLILPAITLCMVFIDLANTGENSTTLHLESATLFNTVQDLKANIPVTGKEVINDTVDEVIKTGNPLADSREYIRNKLQVRMDLISINYKKTKDLEVECNITSVDSDEDPFYLIINSSILVRKDLVTHQEKISQKVSLVDQDCPLIDPLPFIKCKNYGGAQINGSKIYYGSSLTQYLMGRGIENATSYENATASLYIKKCPYNPYFWHGKDPGFIILKNCLENGYFHNSSDGSCFLCRLEGRGTCPHNGLETLISILPYENGTLNSTSYGPCSIDHVIFNDAVPGGTYPGKEFVFFDGKRYFKLFLDNGHRLKYGLPTF